jgi:hypothetical protein
MKATTQGKVCLTCRKRPAAELGFCGECRSHLILGIKTGEVIDPRTGRAWPVLDLITSPRTTV